MKKLLMSAVAIACLSMVACDQNSVLNLARAKVGAKCSSPGAFARDNANVLQCSKKKRWTVNMPILRAIAMINDYNRSQIPKATVPSVTSPPVIAPPAVAPPVTSPPESEPAFPRWVVVGGDGTCWTLDDYSLYCSGRNDRGQLGIGTASATGGGYVLIPDGYNVSSLAMGVDHTCAVLQPETNMGFPTSVWCWGRNDRGQLGDGTTTDRWVPTATPLVGSIAAGALTVGTDHSCATQMSAGRSTISCWGDNTHGQLGTGTAGGWISTPAAVTWPAGADANWPRAGDGFTCAAEGLFDPGQLRCWGRNDRGQVGDGSTTDRAVPTAVAGMSTAFRPAVGRAHVCVQLTSTTIGCWGDDSSGQFGDGTIDSAPHPTPRTITPSVGGRPIYHLTAGGDITCLLVDPVHCAGDNAAGQLDASDPGDVLPTFAVPPVGRFASSTAELHWGIGDHHICAVTAPIDWNVVLPEGACWGDDAYGQISG